MNAFSLFLLALGLSMDAFAAAICKGLAAKRLDAGKKLVAGAWFGGFQAVMPIAGALLGSAFEASISALDHWIAFALLSFIGLNMIHESFSRDAEADGSFRFRSMLLISVATSIDALVSGIPFPMLGVNLVQAALIIGATTFVLSIAGVSVGHRFGLRYKSSAERLGGSILILLGGKILLEHLGVL